eukprot:Gregarina_sp_Poly_1__1862@NODE_1485_length_4019_cov_34_970648_g577_i1_p4_GENE_NODE_1485_length_4019_cov_34_970648_g577_i1NODE_1485_length_4019_cov_34_970648_g577_i1_p4_ORF_typecomplete_len151_score17_22_NODE_1485_length_4019_cov_34_970648_g577_i119242376
MKLDGFELPPFLPLCLQPPMPTPSTAGSLLGPKPETVPSNSPSTVDIMHAHVEEFSEQGGSNSSRYVIVRSGPSHSNEEEIPSEEAVQVERTRVSRSVSICSQLSTCRNSAGEEVSGFHDALSVHVFSVEGLDKEGLRVGDEKRGNTTDV